MHHPRTWVARAAVALIGALPLDVAASPGGPPTSSTLTTSFLKTEAAVTLQYVVQGDPRGPAIVLVHGIGDSWHSWERILPYLPMSYRTFAITLRGHGLSDRPPSGYARADFARDVASFLGQLDLTSVCLVGHSLGSFVAQEVAVGPAASRLGRLVLVGSGPFGPRDASAIAEVRALFRAIKDPIDPFLARDFQASIALRPLPPGFLETMIAEAQRVPARVWNEVGSSLPEPAPLERLKEIRARTLVLWGDKDTMLTRADQDALVASIRGSRLVVYPDTGHAPHWEQPERFARDLVGFLRE